MPKISTTRKDYELLDFITRFMVANGYSPSLGDIARAYSITRSGAQWRLKRLERLGAISRDNETMEIILRKTSAELQQSFNKKTNLTFTTYANQPELQISGREAA